MQDKALINEVRKRVHGLEAAHEILSRDLQCAHGFLTMLERNAASRAKEGQYRNQVEVVGDTVVGILSHRGKMHRKDILAACIRQGAPLGYESDPEKQIRALSTIMSKDHRLKPVEGKPGHWQLVHEGGLGNDGPIFGVDDPLVRHLNGKEEEHESV